MVDSGGNGQRKPLTPWRALIRTVLAVEYNGSRYDVEVDYLNVDKDASLYRDGTLVEKRRTPAKFRLDADAKIEVATSTYGIKKARLSTPDGKKALQPIPETWEHKRIRWHEAHPVAGKLIGAASWIILAVAAVLGIPQLLEFLSALLTETEIGQTLGYTFTFTSPVNLPAELNTVLTIAAVVAGLERATRLKYNWWLDG